MSPWPSKETPEPGLPGGIVLRKTSLLDYPGKVGAVIFLPGCNLRCPWCHNGALNAPAESSARPLAQTPAGPPAQIPLEEALAHVYKRRRVLGGVVISGGEPCMDSRLPSLIEAIHELGLKVKLDTNGMYPQVLSQLFNRAQTRPDYLALDLKLAPARYGELLKTPSQGPPDPSGALKESAALLEGTEHEFRSLALPPLSHGGRAYFNQEDLEALSPLVDGAPWFFRPLRGGCLDPLWDTLEEGAGQAMERARQLAEAARALGKDGRTGEIESG
ncbi:MAG: radical SAM protein [Treponema sp.]|nr:radical SAM protein [Treponema sp.]